MYRRLCDKVLPKLVPTHSRVLVAVSGGPDSVALAHILWRYATERRDQDIELALTHVNHKARPEADEEEQLVVRLAQTWGIPCIVHRFLSKQYAKTSGLSFQEAAREWRYARWNEDMQKGGFTLLATAHHLGDQAETILYRLLRGSGTGGLAGIYPKRGVLIRPLLSLKKDELIGYCVQEGLSYALDQSNEQTIYDRNRIRLDLLPELAAKYNPRILETLGRTGTLLRWDEEFLVSVAEDAWKQHARVEPGMVSLNPDVFSLPPAILSRLIRRAAAQTGSDPRGLAFHFVEAIIENKRNSGWVQDLPGILVKLDSEGLQFLQKTELPPVEKVGKRDMAVTVALSNWSILPEANIKVGLFTEEEMRALRKNNPDSLVREEVFSLAAVQNLQEPLVLRTRRPGDRMWIPGIGHKELKKVFQEAGVTSEQRNGLLLLTSGREVFWIPGVRRRGALHPTEEEEKAFFVVHRLPTETTSASLYNRI